MRIYDRFAYLIRAIVQVIVDMQAFMGVLVITMVAFGEAYLQISMSNEDTED